MKRTLVVLLAVCSAGCSNPLASEPDESPLLQTQGSIYRLGANSSIQIPVTYQNRTGGPVYLTNCGGGFSYTLEKSAGRGWTPVWGPNLPSCLSAPIVIAVGETISRTQGFLDQRAGGPGLPTSEIDGTYRITWPALSTYEGKLSEASDFEYFGKLLPIRYRSSNEFAVASR